jgi:DUF1009 family protein
MRLDVPAVGSDTIKSMVKVMARVLALEAQRSMIVNREKVIKEAEHAGITIIGISADKIHQGKQALK